MRAYDKDVYRVWTPYRELARYRRLLLMSTLLNLVLAAALVYCIR